MSLRKRVVVAMSGGVDSSVAAHLLSSEGYEVIGITMHLGQYREADDTSGCCSLGAVEDARSVARDLAIPHYVVNFERKFQEAVIENFSSEYLSGRTPNPCVVCNNRIKFKALLEKAVGLQADFVATGHYARAGYDWERDRYLLLKGIDGAKDQSYMLYGLTQAQLRHALFPLGGYNKEEVREVARKVGLTNADKPDSQEICFVPEDDYEAFLRSRTGLAIKPGPIVDGGGRVLGTHRGIPFYTIGQRKGLGVSAGKPIYVTHIDSARNTIVVGDDRETLRDELIASQVNFIPFHKLDSEMSVKAKVRYKQRESEATISPAGEGRVRVKFRAPQRAAAPGQSVVFYTGDVVVGGGIIERVV
jgi:tRNA-specific 2-thiouridylase